MNGSAAAGKTTKALAAAVLASEDSLLITTTARVRGSPCQAACQQTCVVDRLRPIVVIQPSAVTPVTRSTDPSRRDIATHGGAVIDCALCCLATAARERPLS
jgi:hypothetical protein